jgi:outer membrane protein assembly factor BamB
MEYPRRVINLSTALRGLALTTVFIFVSTIWLGAAETEAPNQAANIAAASCSMFGCTPARNAVNAFDKNMPTDWSIEPGKQKNIKWVAKLGDLAYGGPVVAGGKVFAGTNNKVPRNPKVTGSRGVLMCFRESDGQFLWQATHDELPPAIAKDGRGQGIASAPAVEGNRLYYVSNQCELVCADAEGLPGGEAKIIWKLDMLNDLKVFPHKLPNGSPLIAGDLVVVSTSNGVDEEQAPSPDAPSLIAVDKNTGKLKWQDNSPGKQIMLGQWSNPAYAVVNGKGQVIFGGGDGWLRGFEADTGKPIWKFDCNPKTAKAGVGAKAHRNYIVATPVIDNNKVYVGVGQEPSLGSGVGHFWCVDITKKGDQSLVDDTKSPQAEVNKKSGCVWHFGGEVDAKTAEMIGRDYSFGRTVSTCAIVDGLVYIPELAGYFHCLDAKTGQEYWVHDLKTDIWGSPYYVDGKIYLGTGDSEINIFAQGKEKKVIGKVEMDSVIYSTPTAANGVLYVMTAKNLYAIVNK